MRMLDKNPNKRLGAKGIEELKDHIFFAEVDWSKVSNKQIIPQKLPVKFSSKAIELH
jgi:hypothetical protein